MTTLPEGQDTAAPRGRQPDLTAIASIPGRHAVRLSSRISAVAIVLRELAAAADSRRPDLREWLVEAARVATEAEDEAQRLGDLLLRESVGPGLRSVQAAIDREHGAVAERLRLVAP